MTYYKISFCTVCMNRLLHLQKTLAANIKSNEGYQNIEFVLLDYNSKDGLADYVMKYMQHYLSSGMLVFYKTIDPAYFKRSHSRNLAFKLATGDILCNVDADNYTGNNFADYINQQFNERENIFLSTIAPDAANDTLGRICVKRADFLKVQGFDERMVYYGFEDVDFVNRLTSEGLTKVVITNKSFLEAISHSDHERIVNEFVANNFVSFLICYLSPITSELLILFTNNEFKRATITNNLPSNPVITDNDKNEYRFDFSILEPAWAQGKWNKTSWGIELTIETDNEILISTSNNQYLKERNNHTYYEIADPKLIESGLLFYSQITNRLIMQRNLTHNVTSVNEAGFGQGTVYKNFDIAPFGIGKYRL